MMLNKCIEYCSMILTSAKKECKIIFSDFSVVFSYIVAILLVGFFYSYVYMNENFDKLPVAMVDNDNTTLSRQLAGMISATPQVDITYSASSLEMGKRLFDEGKVKGVIVIPKDFAKDVQKQNPPSIIAYADASYMLYYKQVLTAVMTSTMTFSGGVEVKTIMSKDGVSFSTAQEKRRPFNINTSPLFNIHDGYGTFLMPVVFIIALQTLQVTGIGVIGGAMREERKYLVNFGYANSKLGAFFSTIGRSLAYLFISMILLLIEILVIMHIFTFPQRGDLFEIVVFLVPVILSISFLGMTLVNFFRKKDDALMVVAVFSIPALMVSGLSWPTTALPIWIKTLSVFLPSTLGIKGFVALSQFGASLNEIKDIYIDMWLITLFYFGLAVWTNYRLMKKESNELANK